MYASWGRPLKTWNEKIWLFLTLNTNLNYAMWKQIRTELSCKEMLKTFRLNICRVKYTAISKTVVKYMVKYVLHHRAGHACPFTIHWLYVVRWYPYSWQRAPLLHRQHTYDGIHTWHVHQAWQDILYIYNRKLPFWDEMLTVS